MNAESIDWISLAINFLITWSVGLSPALITRYAWLKTPIRPKLATWIAGISCFTFFWLFRILQGLLELSPDERSSGIVWVVIFSVSRAIMERGYKKELIERIRDRLNEPNIGNVEREKLEASLQKIQK